MSRFAHWTHTFIRTLPPPSPQLTVAHEMLIDTRGNAVELRMDWKVGATIAVGALGAFFVYYSVARTLEAEKREREAEEKGDQEAEEKQSCRDTPAEEAQEEASVPAEEAETTEEEHSSIEPVEDASSQQEDAATDPMAILAALTDPTNPSPLDTMKALKASLADRSVTPAGLPVLDFLEHVAKEQLPVLDVRSPAEFSQGHIPGAISFPLFSNEERAAVGTAYAQQSKEAAMELAIGLVGPKLAQLLAAAEEATVGRSRSVAVHCWRGGMRSGSVALLLRGNGFRTVTLGGGYKGFRAWANGLWTRTSQAAPVEVPAFDVEDIMGCIDVDASAQQHATTPTAASPTLVCVPQAGPHKDPEQALDAITARKAEEAQARERERLARNLDDEAAPMKVGTESAPKDAPVRLCKADKKLANKAKRQAKKRSYKVKDKQQREEHEQEERQQELAPLRPEPSTPAEWTQLQAGAAMKRLRICVVAGRTGVGKTRVIKQLEKMGLPTIDLEGLAEHRGSAFGWCSSGDRECNYQPTTEQYGNRIAYDWWKCSRLQRENGQLHQWVFIEDEGRMVGKCNVPPSLFAMLRCAPLVTRLVVSAKGRVQLLMEDYTSTQAQGNNPEQWQQDMMESIGLLERKLSKQRVDEMRELLQQREYEPLVTGLLQHYDKLYDFHTENGDTYGCKKEGGAGRHYIVDVEKPEAAQVDHEWLATAVLHEVTRFEQQETNTLSQETQ